ncbi:MAG: hypothetical protein H0U42_00445 [Thermoleophilaceae bacterium]|nr:hypothetical protein [Thermoleophilaceae bacterium]
MRPYTAYDPGRDEGNLGTIGLGARFRSADPKQWREPRRIYDIEAQGAAQVPTLPFFDRGTWEQAAELGR